MIFTLQLSKTDSGSIYNSLKGLSKLSNIYLLSFVFYLSFLSLSPLCSLPLSFLFSPSLHPVSCLPALFEVLHLCPCRRAERTMWMWSGCYWTMAATQALPSPTPGSVLLLWRQRKATWSSPNFFSLARPMWTHGQRKAALLSTSPAVKATWRSPSCWPIKEPVQR